MNFERPMMLLLFVPAVVVFALRILKQGSVTRRTAAWVIWERLVKEDRPVARARSRFMLDHLLEGTALSLVILAVAGLQWSRSEPPGLTVLRRAAIESIPVRADEAMRRIEEMAAKLEVDIQGLRVIDVVDPGDVGIIAAARRDGDSLAICTDRPLNGRVVPHDIGIIGLHDSIRNVGFTAAAATGSEGDYRLFVSIAASSDHEGGSVRLSIRQGPLETNWSLEVRPGSTASRTGPMAFRADAGDVTLWIDVDDDVPGDDRVVLEPPRRRAEAAVDEDLSAFSDALHAAGFQVSSVPVGADVVSSLRVGRPNSRPNAAAILMPGTPLTAFEAAVEPIGAPATHHESFAGIPLDSSGFGICRPPASGEALVMVGEQTVISMIDDRTVAWGMGTSEQDTEGGVFPLLVAATARVLGLDPSLEQRRGFRARADGEPRTPASVMGTAAPSEDRTPARARSTRKSIDLLRHLLLAAALAFAAARWRTASGH